MPDPTIPPPPAGYTIQDVPPPPAGYSMQGPSAGPEDWQKQVKPIDLGGGKQSVQRSDGGVWFGPEQGNTGRPGWFDAQGNRLGDAPGEAPPKIGMLSRLGYGAKEEAKNTLDALIQHGVQSLSSTTGGAIGEPQNVQNITQDIQGNIGQRNTAIASLGTPAKVGQFLVGAVPATAAALTAPEVEGGVLARGLASAGQIAPTTYMTTPGTPQQRAEAAGVSVPATVLGQIVGEKLVGPAIKKVAGKVYNLVAGQTPNVTGIRQDLLSRVAGEPADVFQADLESQYAAARSRAAQPFNALREATGNAPVDLPTYAKALDDAIAREQASRAGGDKGVVSLLQQLKNGLENPNADKTFSGTMDLGSRLNALESDAMSGTSPNRQVAKIIIQLKDALNKDMDAAGSQYGDAYKNAKEVWKQEVVPFEDRAQGGKLLQQFMNSPTPDSALRALAVAKSADKVGIFVKQLSPEGRQALQAGLVDTAFNDAADPVSGKFRVDRFLKAMKDRQEAYNLTFSGEDKWRMDGLMKIMKTANAANVLIPFEKWGVGTSDILQKILTTKAGSRLLLSASDLPVNSPKLAQLAQKAVDMFPPVAGAAAGTKAANREANQ